MKVNIDNKIKLHGFNNLTKTLSFNMYDICYAKSAEDREAYISYIDEQYNADRLTEILTNVTEIIGANILNIAKQDYDPQGASVTILVCENPIEEERKEALVKETPGPLPEIVLAHLDKSHITVHTYPEYHPDEGICTFRADIDVSTCGMISPLRALNYLVHSFEADIMTMDYRVRGFTRDITGRKLFIDHKINSIQNYIPSNIKTKYNMIDVNVYQENIFHTKCRLKQFDLDNYLFGYTKKDLYPKERKKITHKLKKEMDEIFYGKNFDEVYYK
ncbi:S-adenosylmethionine decarboxylase [Clostridium acetobutylicum]|uniref:S-adenosylmethionine decarboxylase proenzyme n=1 Tax=Clostridium acetobutylicum (strain ATCC 824 / DSM 792 / JCM 1419 / IAM 19013 / LMG 5710 / NBRC 13948 / NRRL B-527 / VKM B-1787 / 2291 / W) TaxID=272562 RepID=SPED_CLOAB|nr:MULTISPECIES: adenosylmethionine decarboxylase [Clostridium]Q97FX4.1 RecName: Full=S-adenosylmethionine decarboxylase proenzyme; Short=AdoMetDC; Short=SAMDC; Contains: RecName: Full=S-adenosylmethionine decarboxylase beta chain; Contains: RecName: Full=S-adenosylmethionine decarboxylase alpha chain; Flags: Precursor [Clostridium acetobutylicum ATCC 824]AAK80549.1 S-adenosylmethionine decarboxylase [Clostridium acetobutylicum ATCC 824]ADZ21648.1 S-adenosylmethionine decarboxylase [Clostridium 